MHKLFWSTPLFAFGCLLCASQIARAQEASVSETEPSQDRKYREEGQTTAGEDGSTETEATITNEGGAKSQRATRRAADQSGGGGGGFGGGGGAAGPGGFGGIATGGGLGGLRAPAPLPDDLAAVRLDELLERAAHNNPELAAAEAAVRQAHAAAQQAEAQRNLVRIKTSQELVSLYDQLQRLEKELEGRQQLLEKEFVSEQDVLDVQMKLADVEARLRAMVDAGQPALHTPFFPFSMGRHPAPRPSLPDGAPEEVARLLNESVSLIFEDITLREILEFVMESYELNINIDPAVVGLMLPYVNLENVSLQGVFLALADQLPELVFIVREYGVLATHYERAQTISGPAIPPDVPFLEPMSAGGNRLQRDHAAN